MPTTYLTISNSSELRRIQARHILYIEADQNYCKFHLINNESFHWTIQLGQLEKEIAEQFAGTDAVFVRVGRSHIINLRYVYHIHTASQKLEFKDNNAKTYPIELSQDTLKKLKSMLESDL